MDNTPEIETLIQKLVNQCAGHIEVPSFIADVDALIAAVRAETHRPENDGYCKQCGAIALMGADYCEDHQPS